MILCPVLASPAPHMGVRSLSWTSCSTMPNSGPCTGQPGALDTYSHALAVWDSVLTS